MLNQSTSFNTGEVSRGIVICGGGYRYFANAWLNLRLLRLQGVTLPAEIWVLEEEYDYRLDRLVAEYGAKMMVCARNQETPVPAGTRWQWLLKPWALLNTSFREVLLLDADSFPVRNPEFLFDSVAYRETGAIFWPDIGMTDKERPIWEEMGVPFREEPEFESGQIVIDTLRHKEPLELALQMNEQAEKFYEMIWGDKDTFRFAFHKFGRTFAMPPFPLQMLEVPGGGSRSRCDVPARFRGQSNLSAPQHGEVGSARKQPPRPRLFVRGREPGLPQGTAFGVEWRNHAGIPRPP